MKYDDMRPSSPGETEPIRWSRALLIVGLYLLLIVLLIQLATL